ncbi:NAD(P)/FAD-dependent oxidoreductase [Sediminivirga luteola]|uniref:NAD(P)/FAD-dependent oxidoreductase n=1 Tax=Sediminivirga luteola TaxID=1774748 RepID=UPI001F58225C|nr:FAD-binding oxidoreductase [Sediminivirga luteola]MCI2264753.1 FAD-binding oxidoreductase [Sediminivirga luteola]
MELPASAEVVIIGGGIMGLSIAHRLAADGVRDVVLLEQAQLGSGSTCRAAGGVRAQFSDEINIALGLRGLEVFESFAQDFGQEIDLNQCGYLFLIDEPGALASFEQNVALQNSMGVQSRMLDASEARRLAPSAGMDVLGAAFHPRDGHCTPESVVLGLAAAARRQGVRIITGCRFEGAGEAEPGSGRRALRTSAGTIQAAAVVCAAGAWSAAIGDAFGVPLPVRPLRRQILVTGPLPDLDPALPFTIDFATSLYFHREGAGLLIGAPEREPTWGFEPRRSDEWLADTAELIAERFPGLSEIDVASGWAGLYEMTPDHNALVGEHADDDGFRFLYAAGFSGHGFLMGPGIGEVMADLYAARPPWVDVSGLSAERFTEGVERPELNIV